MIAHGGEREREGGGGGRGRERERNRDIYNLSNFYLKLYVACIQYACVCICW